MTPKHAHSRGAGAVPGQARHGAGGAVVDRRVFLGVIGVGVGVVAGGSVLFAVSGAASSAPGTPVARPSARATAAAVRTPTPVPTPIPTETQPPIQAVFVEDAVQKVARPAGAITALPGEGNLLAWTVDDGSSAEVIRLYTEFAARTGTRLTFFLNGTYEGWAQNAELLRPLVQSGQVQLGNHTFDHVDLTTQSDAGVIDQLQRNHDFILNTYGVDARPFFRPPYGYHDARVDRLAASIGYTCPVLWYGSLSDSGLITEQQVVDFATQWFQPQHIVIGHLNYLPVTNVFAQLESIVTARGLRTVTLDDVFVR